MKIFRFDNYLLMTASSRLRDSRREGNLKAKPGRQPSSNLATVLGRAECFRHSCERDNEFDLMEI